MYNLRLFGGVWLESSTGFVAGPAAQRRRLALLALLGAAPGAVSRDKLLGYLWPEGDEERGRHLLSEALYILRKRLGERAILSLGDDLQLNSGVVTSDVAQFESALQSGLLEQAVGLHRGPFLEGFYLGGSLEFDEWVERVRAELLEKTRISAWKLSEAAREAGDLSQAIQWARRGYALMEDDEAAARRVISLLAEAQDRGGALELYAKLARRLREAYEVDPMPETQALVETIRHMPQPSGNGVPVSIVASGAEARPLSSTPIAVFPFVVRGDPELQFLEDGMVDLLTTSLDGTGELQAVDPHPLLNALVRDRGKRLDSATARVVARKFGAVSYVLGTVVGSPGVVRVTAKLYLVEGDSKAAAQATVEGERGRLFELVDGLAARLIAHLATGAGTRLVRIAALTTASLPALKAYLSGEHAWRAGSTALACDEWVRAAAEDPSFALAHYRLALVRATYERDEEEARRSLAKALRHASRLPERDRLLLHGLRSIIQGAAAEAERVYRRLLDVYADDVEALWGLAIVLTFYNPLRGRPVDKAVEPMERALAIDPLNNGVRVNLAYVRARKRDYALVEALSRMDLNAVFVLQMRTVLAFGQGRAEERERIFSELKHCPERLVCECVRFIAVLTDDLGRAVSLARLLQESSRPARARAVGHVLAGFICAALGHNLTARTELSAAAAFDPDLACALESLLAFNPLAPWSGLEVKGIRSRLETWQPPPRARRSKSQFPLNVHDGFMEHLRLYLLGLACARSGDQRAADDCAARLDRLSLGDRRTTLAADFASAVRAESLRRARRVKEALAELEQAPMEAWNEPMVHSPFHSRARERCVRAMLLERLGREDEALRWYESLEEYAAYDYVYAVPALVRRADILSKQGRAEPAAELIGRFVTLWRNSDDELQTRVREAESRLARLRGKT